MVHVPNLYKTRKSTENRLLGTPKVQWSRKNKVGSIYQGWERRAPLPFYKISRLPRNRFLWTTDSLDRAGSRPPTSNLMLTDWSREVTHPLWSLEWHCALVLILAILAFFFLWSQISAVTSIFALSFLKRDFPENIQLKSNKITTYNLTSIYKTIGRKN